jgi:hypothetical protein
VSTVPEEFDEYLAELRVDVCSRCIERAPGTPPCGLRGKPCGIEVHVPKLVQICRSTDSALMDPYIEQLHAEICENCSNKDGPMCPCPLDYLLQLAVEAIERVESRRAERADADPSAA